MIREEAQQLLEKYINGACTKEEKTLVEHWYLLESSKQSAAIDEEDFAVQKSAMWHAIREMSDLKESRKVSSKVWSLSIAACLFLMIGISSYFFASDDETFKVAKDSVTQDVAPGSSKATLTLADGSKIILDEAAKGLIASESGTQIRKLSNGSISYDTHGVNNSGLTGYNTIETPKGGKYQITLPDGSRVWLNAGSVMRFPTLFTGKERIVSLVGEAYFDIAKNKEMPFKVKTRDMTVSVTGTQFNVMAYRDESYSTATLVEGSVQVSNPKEQVSLEPGQQVMLKEGEDLMKRAVDIDEAIAWKNGLFQFNNADIYSVMKQISRWYNVTVEYRGNVPNKRFGGYISRDSQLSKVLKMLELSGVKFLIDGKKIIVLP